MLSREKSGSEGLHKLLSVEFDGVLNTIRHNGDPYVWSVD